MKYYIMLMKERVIYMTPQEAIRNMRIQEWKQKMKKSTQEANMKLEELKKKNIMNQTEKK